MIKYRISRLSLLTVFIFIVSITLGATNVRGRVDVQNPYLNVTQQAASVIIEFWIQMPNGSQRLAASTTTGYDGFYYVSLVPGFYVIWVNKTWSYSVQVFNVPSQDLPPISIN